MQSPRYAVVLHGYLYSQCDTNNTDMDFYILNKKTSHLLQFEMFFLPLKGATHHSFFFFAIKRCFPGMVRNWPRLLSAMTVLSYACLLPPRYSSTMVVLFY